MINPELIRKNQELVQESCRRRGFDFDFNNFSKDDKTRRKIIKQIDDLRQSRNKLSREKSIDQAKINQGQEIKKKIKEAELRLKEVEIKWVEKLSEIPNVLLPEVPEGKNENGNVVVKTVGQRPQFDFPVKSYIDLGESLDLIDIPRATKIAGRRFSYLKNNLVVLQFALLDLVFELVQEFGFKLVLPPVMIKPELMANMGYTDLKESNLYFIEKDNLNLVGTSEQSIAAMYQDEILDSLPIRYLSYSTCFRREAGTYGRDLKGILRVHQFDKAELFSFCRPEESSREHQLFIEIQEKIMQSLEIPYRVVQLCSGDLAKPSAATVDIESWMPFENKYRETHSSSNCTDYQSRGLNIRYRAKDEIDYVHTINGTALAMGRIMAVIIENCQNKDGSVNVPKILQKRTGFKKIS